jgi:hypothetical protein
MKGLELDAVEKWLYETLSGDDTLRTAVGADEGVRFVFEGAQPQDSPLERCVVFQYIDATDEKVVGAVRIFTTALYQVKGVGEGDDYAPLAPVVARIDALLDRAKGTNAYGEVWGCTREMSFRDPGPAVENGVPYRQAGGRYRLYVS